MNEEVWIEFFRAIGIKSPRRKTVLCCDSRPFEGCPSLAMIKRWQAGSDDAMLSSYKRSVCISIL